MHNLSQGYTIIMFAQFSTNSVKHNFWAVDKYNDENTAVFQ